MVQNDGGSVLYDCVSQIDDDGIAEIERRGGIQYICFSHPYFFDSMVSWSRAFDDASIIIPDADRKQVMSCIAPVLACPRGSQRVPTRA